MSISSVNPTGDQSIDGILKPIRWADDTLTFSFPTARSQFANDYSSTDEPRWIAEMNGVQKDAVRRALEFVQDVTDLRFNEIRETDSQHAILRYALVETDSTAWAYLPVEHERGGDAWFSETRYPSPTYGSGAATTILHETGHTLGLKHPQDSQAFGRMPDQYDAMDYTVMTYNWTANSQTYMTRDIAALQHLYGADYSHRGGDTTYQWNPSTGEMSIDGHDQGRPAANKILLTIWDGGGNDTYDFSNYDVGVQIDLRPGAWTIIANGQRGTGSDGNIANALLHDGDERSLIENAVGGSGDDVLIGNRARNALYGGPGDDTLKGGGGTDSLWGGPGADVFDAGEKDRIMDFEPSRDILL